MSLRSRRVSSILSALCLSGVTLATFVIQGSVGATAVVKDFHRAVAAGNAKAVEATLDLPLKDQRSLICVAVVQSRLQARARVNYGSPQKVGQDTFVITEYTLPNGLVEHRAWVMQRVRGHWKIDVLGSLMAWQPRTYSPSSRDTQRA
jgi:hypothetical protein